MENETTKQLKKELRIAELLNKVKEEQKKIENGQRRFNNATIRRR